MKIKYNQSSFRDPDGYIFSIGSDTFRVINKSYHKNYIRLIESGLYNELVQNNLLVSHKEINVSKFGLKTFNN